MEKTMGVTLTEREESNLLHYNTTHVTPIPAFIVDERVQLLKNYLVELTAVHFMQQDNATINRVLNDINFWKKRGELD